MHRAVIVALMLSIRVSHDLHQIFATRGMERRRPPTYWYFLSFR
jgi:hypothetical protein